MTRIVYGFDDSGNKIPIGSYDDGLLPVGGTIFHINNESTSVYEFYDSNGNVLSNVSVGDSPYAYKRLNSGNSYDKYYVYFEMAENKYWGYENIEIASTEQYIYQGKHNTELILSIIDTSQYANGSIWQWLVNLNVTKLNGCDDWYIGSQMDVNTLINYLNSKGLSIMDFWCSSTGSNVLKSLYYNINDGWYSGISRTEQHSCCAIRSF